MRRSHSHWEGGPPCRFATKRECDENWTQFQHGHLGRPCVKEFQPAKHTTRRKDGTVITQKGEPSSVATCTIVNLPETGQSFNELLATAIAQAPQSWRDERASWERQHGGTLNASS